MTEAGEDTRLQVLHDHYKESSALLQQSLKLRERLFFLLIILATLMLFQVYSPSDSGQLIADVLSKQLGLQKGVDLSFVSSLIWFGLLLTVLKYGQRLVQIDKQYEYIHKLEGKISTYFDDDIYTREGRHYLTDYPRFSSWTHLLYTAIFPLVLVTVLLMKISCEILALNLPHSFIFNLLMCLAAFLSIALYLLALHKNR